MVNRNVGDITIPGDADVWPHEYRTAVALARAGHDVAFVKKSNVEHERTADVLIDGEPWELKAPKASNARAVERNLHRALRQAPRVVFDSRRMKRLPDRAIEHELRKRALETKSCKRVLLINKSEEVIDIK